MDWSDGSYEYTARTLEPAAELVVETLSPAAGQCVLDVGCGTGNAALLSARRGAVVTGLDPAPRLLKVLEERAREERLTIATREGSAHELPFEDASFDGITSVFALIFAPDAKGSVAEVARVARPGARLVMTSWLPVGPIFVLGLRLMGEAVRVKPELGEGLRNAWGEPAFIKAIFAKVGTVTISEREIAFRGASPEAWLDEIFTHHPVWRGVGELVGTDTASWRDYRAEGLELMREANEAPYAFETTSRYYLIDVALG